MANAEKSFIPSATPKRRGRPAKLKAVENVSPDTEKKEVQKPETKRAKKQFTGVFLTEKNAKYLNDIRASSNQSMSHLLNILVDNARAVDLLKGTPLREPSGIKKAREALAKWDKELARKK